MVGLIPLQGKPSILISAMAEILVPIGIGEILQGIFGVFLPMEELTQGDSKIEFSKYG